MKTPREAPLGEKPELKTESWDFGTKKEIEEALEINKKLAESGFDIKKPNPDEPIPKLELEFYEEDDTDLPVSLPGNTDSYEERYWTMFNIVCDLIEEIKYLKTKINGES
jgi:hypothetical protein